MAEPASASGPVLAADLADWQRKTVYAIAASSDLAPRHVFHGQIWGQELAVWRADDGYVNVWENRCLHRGVRLTIGVNLGHELMCQYHGWRYANRTAGCTYIPAHPADAPARTVCNRTYPAIERHGLIWTALAGDIDEQSIPELPEACLPLRAVEVIAPLEAVKARLPNDDTVRFFLQPVDGDVTVIRGVLLEPTDGSSAARLAALVEWDDSLSRLRDEIEAAPHAVSARIPHEITPVGAEMAIMPDRQVRAPRLRVRVAQKWPVASDVMAFRLEPLTGCLPAFQPGAHLDVHLPNGLIRQYSITNGPDETTAYTIAVKLEDSGGGGSKCLHRDVAQGDVLAISEPRNNFPLRRDQLKVTFIAGGIGITPLLAMARTLDADHCSYALHCFARSDEALPFGDALAALGPAVTRHIGLDAERSAEAFRRIIGTPGEKESIYVCGPPAMLDAVRGIAREQGWPDEDVHFEYFQNEMALDQSKPFEVALARSAVTIAVPAGQSIVEAVREHGVTIPTSCEKGACGTCRVAVIEGSIEHNDVYLTEAEKARGDCMMACVSRGVGRLVLDL